MLKDVETVLASVFVSGSFGKKGDLEISITVSLRKKKEFDSSLVSKKVSSEGLTAGGC